MLRLVTPFWSRLLENEGASVEIYCITEMTAFTSICEPRFPFRGGPALVDLVNGDAGRHCVRRAIVQKLPCASSPETSLATSWWMWTASMASRGLPIIEGRSQATQLLSNPLDLRMGLKRIEHVDIAAAHVGDVAGHENEAMDASGRRERSVTLILLLRA